jgi:hypothetical protein
MSAANAQIGDWLGIQPPATDWDIPSIVHGRLATSIIKRLAALGLDRSEIDEAVIPSRTLQHRRTRREMLTIEESDRVLRMIRTLSAAERRTIAWALYDNSCAARRKTVELTLPSMQRRGGRLLAQEEQDAPSP